MVNHNDSHLKHAEHTLGESKKCHRKIQIPSQYNQF